ncbi:MAG: hypothetical protein HQL94_09885 [Magnetococcales bacterium]|nr:hypothetical protein [Magnetococcales bacterium]MBF0438616.1 hypothetical protein [Magnetococcales bacterium]
MIVKGESDDTVTNINFAMVREYIFAAIEKGRMSFSGWPLENLQAIPDTPDEEGQAAILLGAWVERHMVKKTRAMMFADLREAQFEAAKQAAEVILSQETRNALKNFRDRVFGEGQGSMELAVKHLLELANRALPQDAMRLLDSYRQRKGLKSARDAIQTLVDQAERKTSVAELPSSAGSALHQEMKALLKDLKS